MHRVFQALLAWCFFWLLLAPPWTAQLEPLRLGIEGLGIEGLGKALAYDRLSDDEVDLLPSQDLFTRKQSRQYFCGNGKSGENPVALADWIGAGQIRDCPAAWRTRHHVALGPASAGPGVLDVARRLRCDRGREHYKRALAGGVPVVPRPLRSCH
jgi:hypothetical protein